MALALVAHANNTKPSKEMQKIHDERFAAPSMTSGLKERRYDDLVDIEKLATFEKYRILHPPRISDIIE